MFKVNNKDIKETYLDDILVSFFYWFRRDVCQLSIIRTHTIYKAGSKLDNRNKAVTLHDCLVSLMLWFIEEMAASKIKEAGKKAC